MVVSSTIQFKASFLEQQGQIFNPKLQFKHSKVLFDEQDLNFNPELEKDLKIYDSSLTSK